MFHSSIPKFWEGYHRVVPWNVSLYIMSRNVAQILTIGNPFLPYRFNFQEYIFDGLPTVVAGNVHCSGRISLRETSKAIQHRVFEFGQYLDR